MLEDVEEVRERGITSAQAFCDEQRVVVRQHRLWSDQPHEVDGHGGWCMSSASCWISLAGKASDAFALKRTTSRCGIIERADRESLRIQLLEQAHRLEEAEGMRIAAQRILDAVQRMRCTQLALAQAFRLFR